MSTVFSQLSLKGYFKKILPSNETFQHSYIINDDFFSAIFFSDYYFIVYIKMNDDVDDIADCTDK